MSAPECVLSLDGFQFEGFEIPEQITFGGQQMLAIQDLPGGVRIIDAMGRKDLALEWAGLFLGPNAQNRARLLDRWRRDGSARVLTWGQFRYSVVISNYEPTYRRSYRIPYKIKLEVIDDLTQPAGGDATVSLDDQVRADVKTADGLAKSTGNSTLAAISSAVSSATAAVSNIATAAQSALDTILVPAQQLEAEAETLLASVSNTLKNISTLGGLLPDNPLAAKVYKLNQQVALAEQSYWLNALGSYIGRTNTNLALNAGSANASTVPVTATSLYETAAKYYGDATQWTRSANASGLTDPQVYGIESLTVPSTAGNASGGVL